LEGVLDALTANAIDLVDGFQLALTGAMGRVATCRRRLRTAEWVTHADGEILGDVGVFPVRLGGWEIWRKDGWAAG